MSPEADMLARETSYANGGNLFTATTWVLSFASSPRARDWDARAPIVRFDPLGDHLRADQVLRGDAMANWLVLGIAFLLFGVLAVLIISMRISAKLPDEKAIAFFGTATVVAIAFFGTATVVAIGAAAVFISQGMNTTFSGIQQPPARSASNHGTLASWVQVVPKDATCVGNGGSKVGSTNPSAGSCAPVFSIRAVVMSGQKCPEPLTIDDRRAAQPWQTREPTTTDRNEKFAQIRVCEMRLSATPKTIKFPGSEPMSINWDLDKGGPERIALFGDTGCRGAPKKQPCDWDWTFQSVAESAARAEPGLVVHLGDYLYDAADDSWDDWDKYFFVPAKALLRTAPVIFVRGNHENCLKGSQWAGFELFFGDGFNHQCPQEFTTEEHKKYTRKFNRPYAIDLTTALRLIVGDSSGAYADDNSDVLNTNCTSPAQAQDCDKIIERFSEISKLTLPNGGENWLATQVPIFAVEKLPDSPHGADVDLRADDIPKPSAMMLAAWTGWKKKNSSTPSRLKRIFSGDLHLMQVIRPKDQDQPSQITIGTGGVQLDPLPVPEGIPAGSYTFVDNYVLSAGNFEILRVDANQGCSDRRNGYLLAQIKGDVRFEFRPLSRQGCTF
jgi:hypothetical protein